MPAPVRGDARSEPRSYALSVIRRVSFSSSRFGRPVTVRASGSVAGAVLQSGDPLAGAGDASPAAPVVAARLEGDGSPCRVGLVRDELGRQCGEHVGQRQTAGGRGSAGPAAPAAAVGAPVAGGPRRNQRVPSVPARGTAPPAPLVRAGVQLRGGQAGPVKALQQFGGNRRMEVAQSSARCRRCPRPAGALAAARGTSAPADPPRR